MLRIKLRCGHDLSIRNRMTEQDDAVFGPVRGIMKATIRFVMAARPHAKTRLPVD